MRLVLYPVLSDQAFVETAQHSFYAQTNPVYCLGDSIANETPYYDGGGVMSRIWAAINSKKYVPLATSIEGGTTLADFLTRFNADSEYHGYNLLIFEGGLDTAGVDCWGSIQSMITQLSHDRYLVVEPVVAANKALGSDARADHDAAWNEIVTNIGTSRVIYTKQALADANDGSAGDLQDVADDVCPRSLRTDGIHLNAAGQDVFAAAMRTKLAAEGWV